MPDPDLAYVDRRCPISDVQLARLRNHDCQVTRRPVGSDFRGQFEEMMTAPATIEATLSTMPMMPMISAALAMPPPTI